MYLTLNSNLTTSFKRDAAYSLIILGMAFLQPAIAAPAILLVISIQFRTLAKKFLAAKRVPVKQQKREVKEPVAK